MRNRHFSRLFQAACPIIASAAILTAFLVSCDGGPEAPDPATESSDSVETGADPATEKAPSANTNPMDQFVFPSEGVICVERVYYDGSPTPETENLVYFRAPENAVEVVIPDGVTEIAPDAFKGNPNLESVVIPNSVRSIPAKAFSYTDRQMENTKLRSVVIPAHASIGSRAFYSLPSLESVTLNIDGQTAALPRDGIQIGDEAFGWCRKLKRIEFPEGIRSIGKMAFIGCSMESVTLPYGVETIGEQAFQQCKELKTLHLPDSVKTIGAGAFTSCGALKEVAIPESVTEIGKDAFRYCPCEESVRRQMESRGIVAPPLKKK